MLKQKNIIFALIVEEINYLKNTNQLLLIWNLYKRNKRNNMTVKKKIEVKKENGDKEYAEWREKYKYLELKANSKPLINVRKVKDYLFDKRLARLILITVSVKKICFLNDIYEFVNKTFGVHSYTGDYLRAINKLSLYNLITIRKLKNCPNKELMERYHQLKTKCPISRIHHYSFNSNMVINVEILKYCSELEFKK